MPSSEKRSKKSTASKIKFSSSAKVTKNIKQELAKKPRKVNLALAPKPRKKFS